MGTVVLLVLVAATVFVSRHKIANQVILAGGKRAIANHLATPVDLTGYYGTPASYFDQITRFPAWKTVPRWFQVFDNVPLEIGGMICLWGGRSAQGGLIFPEQVVDIGVNQKFETLYVCHGGFFDSPDKTPVCKVVFHYEDGSSATNQLLYGSDILDWNVKRAKGEIAPTGPHSKLAWMGGTFTPGRNEPVRFCLTAIENPLPSLEVTSIDLVSCKNRTAPCILALTTGRSGLMK
ncbi:MAG: hypothetical protein ABSH11_04160 [Verrucomicrobiota bacterium]